MGSDIGAHDGTDQVETDLNDFVYGGDRRAVVVAAGNSAGGRRHVAATVRQGVPLDLVFEVDPRDRNDNVFCLWYDAAHQLDMRLTAPTGQAQLFLHGSGGALFPVNPADVAQVGVIATAGEPQNGDNSFEMGVPRTTAGRRQVDGRWTMRLLAAASDVPFHCWFMMQKNPDGRSWSPSFVEGTAGISDDSTVTIPATARGAITVANYRGKADSSDCSPSNDIHPSSGRGPLRKNGVGFEAKPDLAAPGTLITSAMSSFENGCIEYCSDRYRDMTGTSQAAPHVAGTVALMMQANALATDLPPLTRDIAFAMLQQTSPRSEEEHDKVTGWGLVNARGAVFMARGGRDEVPALATLATSAVAGTLRPALGRPADGVVATFRASLAAVEHGDVISSLISRYFSEVRRLINTNSKVATLWHRAGGPAVLRQLARHAGDASVPLPVIDAAQLQRVSGWLDLVARYGSPRLKADIDRHRAAFVDVLQVQMASSTDRVRV
jgi:subtilisin family serine protease